MLDRTNTSTENLALSAAAFRHVYCEICDKHDYCRPLHGDRGGPLCCLSCAGKWEAEHRPRQRARRVLVKALKAYGAAGGSVFGHDFDKLKLTATSDNLFGDDTAAADFSDLTTELLTATLALVHPDKHPPERRAEAQRITQELLALKPFVFPAPEPEPTPKSKARSKRSDADDDPGKHLSNALDYPCNDCCDTVPILYCTACRAEYDKREKKEFEQRTAKQRAEYARRREALLTRRPPVICFVCLKEFRSKRSDARFCSERCRQQAHRKAPVTDKNSTTNEHSFNRDRWKRGILALLNRHRAVYLNDLLPESRTRAQYQQLFRVAAELEDAGQIETVSYLFRFNHPGHKVLVKPGHRVKDRKVVELKNNERLPTTARNKHKEESAAQVR
jgi:hypothetical protein